MMRKWIVFSFLLAVKAAAQKSPPDPTFRTGTELVQVSVVAQDKQGKPVADLRREDFQIFDNGARQEIRLFLSDSAEPPPPKPTAPGTFTNRIAETEGSRSGYSVILLDNLNTGFEHTARARLKALEAFKSIPPGDKIAMYSLWCQFQVIRDFTADRDSLLRRLQAFLPAAGAPCAESVPEPEALPANRSLSMGDLIDPGGASARARAAADAARIASLQAGTTTDREMMAIADHLAGIPGRKNLLWIAQKFPLSPAALQRLLNANVAIYPIDAIGSTIALASEKDAHAAPIRALARMTGGVAYVDRDDLDVAIRESLEDGHISYTLGFYRPDKNRNAAVHRIEVRSSREGVDLRYRTSYSVEAPKPKAANRVQFLVDAIDRPVNATAIAMTVAATRSENKLDLALTLDVSELDLQQKNGFWEGQAELIARFLGNDGKIAGRIIPLTMRLHLRPATYAAALQGGFEYRAKIAIPPKAVDLNLLVGNLASGKIGTLTIPLSAVRSQSR